MKLKLISLSAVLISIVMITLISCGGNPPSDTSSKQQPAAPSSANPEYDAKRGVGKFTHVDIPAALDKTMADAGNKIYEMKCISCHKLSEEKLVGPGWKGVTSRRTPEWIMNFATNTDEMISKDPAAQAMLEICMVRMPNQSLSDDDARHIYEFMRRNDGVK